MKNIVVVSTGRTGTKYLSDFFSDNLINCVSEHESSYSRIFNILGNMYLSGFVVESFLKWLWCQLKTPDHSDKIEYYIDSNNHLYVVVGLVREYIPNLKVVHVVRDPRSYVISHVNWMKTRKRSFIANKITPFWQPNAFLLGEMPFKKWYQLTQFEKFCWIWDFKNRYMYKRLSTMVDLFTVRFEDLFSPSESVRENTFGGMLDFVGGEKRQDSEIRFGSQVNQSNKGKDYRWNSLSKHEVAAIDHYCGDFMEEFGYGNEAEWQKLLMDSEVT